MIKNGIYYKALEVLEAQYEMLNEVNEEQIAKAVRHIVKQLNTSAYTGSALTLLGNVNRISVQNAPGGSRVSVSNVAKQRTYTDEVEGLLVSEQPTKEEITKLIEAINHAWCNVNNDIIL